MNTKVNNTAIEFKPPTQADQVLAVSTSVVQLASAGLPASHQAVYGQVQANTVRVTYDGSNPSATNGEQMTAGTRFTVSRDTALAMKFIRESADASVWVQPFAF
jgi:hypothetical protein